MNGETMDPQDVKLLQSLKDGGGWLRAVLCTLARRGVLLRQDSPTRAKTILDALATLPYYKGGQFLFDLLELEDFMLDGPPPTILPTALNASALQKLAGMLDSVRASLDGSTETAAPVSIAIENSATAEQLPPIEAGFYLYQDVVLGVWLSVVETSSQP